MWAYITTGTAPFLLSIVDAHPAIDFSVMKDGGKTTIYYEDTKKKGIFVSGRKLNILHQSGTLSEDGYVVMQHVPVSEDGTDTFEERMQANLARIVKLPGLVALRFLKQHKQNHYILFTQWESKRYFDNWTDLYNYEEMEPANLARLPAYFAERPFTNAYYMLTEEDREKLK